MRPYIPSLRCGGGWGMDGTNLYRCKGKVAGICYCESCSLAIKVPCPSIINYEEVEGSYPWVCTRKWYNKIMVSTVHKGAVSLSGQVEMILYAAWKIIRVRKISGSFAPYPVHYCSLLDPKWSSSGNVVSPKVRKVVAIWHTTKTKRRFNRWATQSIVFGWSISPWFGWSRETYWSNMPSLLTCDMRSLIVFTTSVQGLFVGFM